MNALPLLNLLHLGSRFIWHGMYPRFQDVPCYGQTLEQESYAQRILTRTSGLQRMAAAGERLPDAEGQFRLLPLLVSMLASRRIVRILDFGGGLGVTYLHLKQSLMASARVEYQIVETSRMCQLGRELFTPAMGITFHQRIERARSPVDIAYVSSALQYIEDYAAILEQLCHSGAAYLLLNKFSTGEFPTYATAQRIGKSVSVPYWFINYQETVDRIGLHGYRLLYTNQSGQEYDQRNFPPRYRMGRTWNLLFGRERCHRKEE